MKASWINQTTALESAGKFFGRGFPIIDRIMAAIFCRCAQPFVKGAQPGTTALPAVGATLPGRVAAPAIIRPVIWPLLATLLLPMALFFTSTGWIGQRETERGQTRLVQTLLEQRTLRHQRETRVLKSQLDILSRIETLQQAFLADDRQALLRTSRPLLRSLRENGVISHLYFHLPDRVNFLRTHRPERHGDRIDRHTLVTAERTGRLAHGLELGPLGSLTLRVVTPWWREGELIGYLELGKEVSHTLSDLQKQLGVRLFTLIEKRFLKREQWLEGMRMLGFSANWDRFANVVLTGANSVSPPSGLGDYLARPDWRSPTPFVTIAGRYNGEYRENHFFSFAIQDVRHRTVGHVVVVQNDMARHHVRNVQLLVLAIISVVLAGLLTVSFYYVLKRVEGDIRSADRRLRDKNALLTSEIQERKRLEHRRDHQIESQKIINAICNIPLQSAPLKELLDLSLEKILSMPWLPDSSMGAIYLFDEPHDDFRLVSHKNMKESHLQTCAQRANPHCLCNRAVETGRIHVRTFSTAGESMPHPRNNCSSHYVVPILSEERLLGLINLFPGKGQHRRAELEELLRILANTLSNLIGRKRDEKKLIDTNRILEKRVHERTLELQENLQTLKLAQEKLVRSETMAALGGLVAGVAHEINTPVGIGYTAATHLETITRSFVKVRWGVLEKDEKTARFLGQVAETSGMIIANLHRAAELIESFKKVAVDQTSQDRRVFNLRSYLDEILLSIKPTLKKSPHRIIIDCPRNLTINGHPGAVAQVLSNLLENSMHHAFKAGEAGRIDITADEKDGWCSLLYRDDGQGMERSAVKRIYEPFFTTRRGQGGSGLGMHIVYNLVTQKLGGEIYCQSAPKRGFECLIRFPIDPAGREKSS